MNKEMRKNRRRGKVGRRLIGVFLALNLFISAFSGIVFFHYTPEVAKAADPEPTSSISIETYDGQTLPQTLPPYEMTVGEMLLKLKYGTEVHYENENDFVVEWNVETGSDCIQLLPGSSQVFKRAKALKSGDATISVTVYQKNVNGTKGSQLDYVSGNIHVQFAIDTSLGTYFSKVYESDQKKSLIMYVGDPSRSMKFNFGEASDALWTTANEEVATVGERTGTITAAGAGFTTISADYTNPNNPSQTEHAEINVYVVPKARGESDTLYSVDPDIKLDSGESFYVDAKFTNNTEVIRSKVYWSVRQDDGNGNRVEIANSKMPGGLESDLISLVPVSSTSNQIQVFGTAGEYFVYLYVSDPNHKNDMTNIINDKYGTYNPTVIKLTIKSSIVEKEVTLGIGDSLDLAQSYNMTTNQFLETFSVELRDDKNGQGNTVESYASYNSGSARVTALREKVVYATMTVIPGKENYVKGLKGLNPDDPLPTTKFNTKITIVDGITLAPSSVVIMVGQEYQLSASLHGTYTGAITWSSSDPSFVTVNNVGLIKGIKETNNDVTVTASVQLVGGITRAASTRVKVETAMTDFTLNPEGDKFMNVGDVLTLEAKIKETVSVAPLRWISSKENVFSVTPSADGKTAVINALEGGMGTLMVENTLNGKRVQIDITVRIPITKLEFDQEDEYKFPFYQNGHNMKERLNIEPSDATSTALKWSISDSSIASIDSAGYLKFKKPGTVSITARPEHNPNNLYANAIVKIIGGPDEIIFENLKDDHLDIEAGDTKTVNLKFVPDTAETKLIWKTDKAGVCHLDYDEERKQLEVVGQKPGSCTVTCRTEDNVYYSFTVTCTEASTGIEFEKDSVTLYNGDPINGKFQLVPKLKPTTSTDTVTYKMRDDKIATVSDKGLLTAVAAGKTYVSATTSSGKTAIVDVIVVDKVTKVTGDFKRATVYIGEALTISPKITPQTAANKNIKWSWEPYETDDPGSVELDERGSEVIVTGKTEGMVVLTGVSEDNSSAYVEYTLTVKYRTPQYSTKVTLSPKVKYVNVGKKFKVSRSVKNAYNGNRTLKWKSSNRRVATVSSSGRVKARKVGKATISATCLDGSKAKGSMKVVVRRLVTKIKMNKSNANILVGRSVRLSVRITPSNATIKGVKWKSGDTSIATVDGGKVIGVAPGMVKITATSKDATKKKTYCWVTVSEPVPVTNFTIADANLTVAKGSSIQSGMVPNPSNATDSIKYWSDTPSVATVTSKGKIKGVRPGKATIYARAANGVEGHVDVTVVDINRKAVTLLQYATEQLSIYNITTGITWYSAKPEIASVDANGLVKAKLPGKTIIYAYVDGVKLGCEVTVRRIK